MFDPKIDQFRLIFDEYTSKPAQILVIGIPGGQDAIIIRADNDEKKEALKLLKASLELFEVSKSARALLKSKSKQEDIKALEKLAQAVETLDARHCE